MKRFELFKILNTEDQAVAWCQFKGLLKYNPECSKCKSETNYNTKTKNYRCKNRKCLKIISVRSGTLFHNSKLDIKILTFLLYEWTREISIKAAAFEYIISISNTAKWYNFEKSLQFFS